MTEKPIEVDSDAPSVQSTPFDPTSHGFVYLPDHQPPGCVKFYEYQNHSCADGSTDYHRDNIYLSQDGEFVNIWLGFLEPILAEVFLEKNGVADPKAWLQEEPLFRGYIESGEHAKHVLKAFRWSHYTPSVLRANPEKGAVRETLTS